MGFFDENAPAVDPTAAAAGMGSIIDPWTQNFSFQNYTAPATASFTPQTYRPTAFNGPSEFQAPAAFKAPTAEEAMNDPGVLFQLKLGQKAREGSAAFRGSLRTGGLMKGLEDYAQGLASTSYGNVYNRRFGENQNAFNQALGTQQEKFNEAYQPWSAGNQFGLQANAQANSAGLSAAQLASQNALNAYNTNLNTALTSYDIARSNFYNNQDRPFSKLSSLASMGANTATGLGNMGQGYAGLYGNTQANNAAQIGNLYTGAGNAQAAGQVGSANAWNNALGNVGQNATNLWALSKYGPQSTPMARTISAPSGGLNPVPYQPMAWNFDQPTSRIGEPIY